MPVPRYHDCEYVRQRNALIERAEEIVSFVEVVPPSVDEGESCAKWTRCFSTAMDTLAQSLNGS